MNKEELLENISILDDKDIFEKLDKNKELRDWFLVELNVSLQRSESIVANIKDRKELKCYKNAVTSLEQENQKYKEVIDKAINELFILKDMIYKPETREENFEIQRKISSIIKRLNGKEVE